VGRGSHGSQECTPHRISTAESAGASDLLEALVRTLQLPARSFGSHLQDIVGWRFSQLAREHALENCERSWRFGLPASARTGCLLKSLTPEQWKHCGMHSERGQETIGHIVRMTAGHDINHLRQIEQILPAKRK